MSSEPREAVFLLSAIGQLITSDGEFSSSAMPVSTFRRMVARDLGLDYHKTFAIRVRVGKPEDLELIPEVYRL